MEKKSYAKVNIFLKIAGRRDNYHEIVSRFVRVKNLYDVISFQEEQCETFQLKGSFGCKLEKNTIYKAYKILSDRFFQVEKYFKQFCVNVEKNIPEFAGLGGGSSNAATFMLMVNDVCNLGLSKSDLAKLALDIGADVPFFIYEYNSANVTGIGEIVEKFDEDELDIEVITPNIQCNTQKIFEIFREKYYKEISETNKNELLSLKSNEIMNKMSVNEANDLFESALYLNSELSLYNKEKFYFSGSGSSFFRIKDGK